MTHGSVNATTGRLGAASACLLAVLSATPLQAAEIGQRFASVQAFVDSHPQGRADVTKGYGDLVGAGRRDWAASVSLEDPEIGSAQRIVVLAQQADGSYELVAQGPTRSTFGGTAHHDLDDVRVRQASVFVSWSWNWHGCGGSSTQQIRFYRQQWRVIGAEFTRASAVETPDGYDGGDVVRISHNLLTGAIVMNLKPADGNGKPKTMRLTHAPVTELLDDDFGEDTGAVEEFSTYGSC